MVIYWSLFFIITICSLEGFKLKKESTLYYIVVVIIIAFAAFRGNGYDWLSYQDIYNNLQEGGEQTGVTFVEYGFQVLCKISPFYKFLIFITSVISIYYTLSSTYYFSKSYFPILGLLIFSTTLLLPTYMGQIRQGIAIAFVCRAIWENYIGKKKYSVLLIIFACLFHVSAILSCIIFFIPSKSLPIKKYLVILVAALAFNSVCMTLMVNAMNYFQVGVVQKLMVYAASEQFELGLTSTILIRTVTLLVAVFLNKDKNKSISYICNIYLCGLLVYLLFGFLPQLGGRGAYYFSIYEIVLIPYIIYQLRKNTFICFSAFIVIICLSAFRYYSFFSDAHNYQSYVPYLLY